MNGAWAIVMRHGSHLNPPNRFEKLHQEADFEHLEWDQEHLREVQARPIEYVEDRSQTIVSENRSPDIPFRYSINPYRGCIHGCAYCYARPTHEYLGFNAGLDFETKIVIKPDAAELFRQFLSRKDWVSESIAFSGVTDCYQPAERDFRLTRQCLEVANECCQAVSLITKNALIARDLDLLGPMAAKRLVRSFVSVTTLDASLARDMEPRTSIPEARLRAISMLARAGVPVGVMVAPIIPGLNDAEVPAILSAAREAGATAAGYVMLRLPLTVEPVFREWLQRTQPNKVDRVLERLRGMRGGKLNQAEFGSRMVGNGVIADQIKQMFTIFRDKLGMTERLPALDTSLFTPPLPRTGQLRLF